VKRLSAGDPAFDYAKLPARDNSQWPDHAVRAQVTAGLVAAMGGRSVCDPACGDGSIVISAHLLHPFAGITFGDINPANCNRVARAIAGGQLRRRPPKLAEVMPPQPLEVTLAAGHWHLVVLTEILEHLGDPAGALALAAEHGDRLVASSPIDEQDEATGEECPEHVWSFSRGDYLRLIRRAGWRVHTVATLTTQPAAYRWLLVGAVRP
jgi:hypothetical protein